MPLTLDHIFIITEHGAAAAKGLSELGLTEGNTNIHSGQGTSNKRFFLNGFTIELLYVSDVDEAVNGAGRRLGIHTRACDVEASPFGIVVRVSDVETIPDFPSWQYFPDYFDGNMCFYVGENSDQLKEPLCICVPPLLPRSSGLTDEYANVGWQLTALEINVPVKKPSVALKHFAAVDQVRIEFGKPHRMTMKFNDGVAGRLEDLTPALPLILEW